MTNLLQLLTMPCWVGDGVATPLLGVVVLVVGPVELLEVVVGRVVVVVVVLVVPEVTAGSYCASTQYERPAGSVPQFAGTDGF